VRSERERLLEAMVRSTAANGYEATTVAHVIASAGLSRDVFDEMFADKESCFLAAYDAAVDVLVAHVAAAYESAAGEPWPDRIAAALRALAELFATEADIARMAVVEVTAVGEDARLHYRDALGRFTPFLEEGRAFASRADALPADTARFAIGGATAMIFDEVRAGRTAELPQMVPDLAFAVLMPYLGPEQAEAEMRRLREGG
jgi:AcrR family transcriptional regulator